MEDATNTMIENLKKNTGKSLEEWISIVDAQNFEKHGQIMKFLKTEHGFTHGFANMVALKARKADAGSVENLDDLVETQYSGKETLRPIYDALIHVIADFGSDVEIAPKKSYVSVRRKKQFAMLTPATKKRFELGLNLKDIKKAKGKLEEIKSSNAMCSHKINLSEASEVDKEVIQWLKQAYDGAQ